MNNFKFNERVFVKADMNDPVCSPDVITQSMALRMLYPEVANWSHAAFLSAWKNFSEEIYAISWVDWLDAQREPGFLAFCYVRQRWPQFDFGGTGLYDCDVLALGEEQPWAQLPPPPAPLWVAGGILKKDLPEVMFSAGDGEHTA